MHFKRAVVGMRSVVRAHGKAVVIHNPIATIGVSEERDVLPLAFLLHVQEVAWDEVERGGVEANECVKVLRANAVVTELRRSLF